MYKFINPYNFIPFGDKAIEVRDKKDQYRGENVQKELLSGWIDVEIDVKTPLIIPDGAHPKYYDKDNNKYVQRKTESNKNSIHLEYDFNRMFNPETEKMEYGVPGSELRGMIRSSYETVTNSCFPFLMDDKPMSQRVPLYGALTKRGLLGYNGEKWVLFNTEKKLVEVLVVPLYEVKGQYYIESLDEIRKNKDNFIVDKKGAPKYAIIQNLKEIETKLSSMKYDSKSVNFGVKFEKKQKPRNKWDIKQNGIIIAEGVDKRIYRHLFILENGTVLKETPGQFVEGEGWLQYNVPVDTSKVYHIAYLTKKYEKPLYEWDISSPKGIGAHEGKDDRKAEAYKKLKSTLKRDGANGKNTNEYCNKALLNCLENACTDKKVLVPVYYFIVNNEDEEIVYMSGSASGRIAQRRKWADIMMGHTPCEKELCPACLLFGTVKDEGMKGHIRFSDAFLCGEKNPIVKKHTLSILGSPRTTAFEFYLKKPCEDSTYWNFDFYGVTEVGADGSGESSHTNYYHLKNALPRGRKMYWHHQPRLEEEQKTNMNNTMECLENGRFSFKIFFDQITKNQLSDLIWIITLGENTENSNLQHMLGHAKPLGFGSIKMLVKGGKIRSFTSAQSGAGFSFETKDLSEKGIDVNLSKPTFDLNAEPIKAFLLMCNATTVKGQNVDYPRLEDRREIFKWFAENRTNYKTLKTMPYPLDIDLSLVGDDGRKKGNGNNHLKNTIKVYLNRIQPDRKDEHMQVGFVDDGMVFNIPSSVKNFEEIEVALMSEKDGRKMYKYVGTAK